MFLKLCTQWLTVLMPGKSDVTRRTVLLEWTEVADEVDIIALGGKRTLGVNS